MFSQLMLPYMIKKSRKKYKSAQTHLNNMTDTSVLILISAT